MKYHQVIKEWGPAVLAVALCLGVIYTFAQKPAEAPVVEYSPQSVQLALGERSTVGEVTLLPITLMEDSRCPADVQCIQAGTVKVQVQIVSGMGPSVMIMEMGKPVTTEAEEIVLTEVSPAARTGVQPPKEAYRFTFEVRKRTVQEVNP